MPMNLSVSLKLFGWGMLVILLVTAAPEDGVQAREWITSGRSSYSSFYHTQSWSDSIYVSLASPSGARWSLNQGLQQLRNDLSGGADLRQRRLHAQLTMRPEIRRKLGWILDADGNESAMLESIDRRSWRSRALLGGEWNHDALGYLAAQVGAVASHHAAGTEKASDIGFAQRIRGDWDIARTLSRVPDHVNSRVNVSHVADYRPQLGTHESAMAWEADWNHPSDSIVMRWSEEWSDTRFYPTLDRFSEIGRQDRRHRSARIRWTHAPQRSGMWVLRNLPLVLAWRAELDAQLDKNTYVHVSEDEPTGILPSDTRTSDRSYWFGITPRIEGMSADIEYRYRWNTDRFGEARRDQTGETGQVAAAVYWRLTDSDSLIWRSVFRVTSYTVPGDSSFFADRDQAERVVDLYWWHRFSPVLRLRPLFSFREFRQVFLSGQLSANNNTDDVYLLAPEIEWTLSHGVDVAQRFAIRAHYRFFDFERSDPTGRGTLYRKAESETRTRLAQSDQTEWHLDYTYRYEDFGGLFDRDGWVQSVDWDRRSHLIDGRLRWRPMRGLTIEPEYGFEYKRSFNHRLHGDSVRRVEDDPFRRHHISVRCRWNTANGYVLHLAIGRRVQRFGSSDWDRDDRWELTLSKVAR